MPMSWGDIHANTTVTPSTNTVPIPIGAALTSTSSSQSQSSASRTPSRLPLRLRSLLLPQSRVSNPTSRCRLTSPHPYPPSTSLAPAPTIRARSRLTHIARAQAEPGTPSMLSPISRVNINTGPRVPISPQMCAGSLPVQLALPHLHPTNLNGTVSPASVCVELHLHANSPHVRPTQLGLPPVTVTATAVDLAAVFLVSTAPTGRDG
jgi:hypothetical protein